jgi:methylmalonyl-CoA/ethylmalonyl-CoA epimerase
VNDVRIDHIGYLVKDIDKAIAEFEQLGYVRRGEVCYDEVRRADMAFIENSGYVVEVVAPRDEASVVWNLLKRNGSGPYHICYETDDIKEAESLITKMSKGEGFLRIQSEQEAPALGGRKVSFYVGRNIGMIELVEGKKEEE